MVPPHIIHYKKQHLHCPTPSGEQKLVKDPSVANLLKAPTSFVYTLDRLCDHLMTLGPGEQTVLWDNPNGIHNDIPKLLLPGACVPIITGHIWVAKELLPNYINIYTKLGIYDIPTNLPEFFVVHVDNKDEIATSFMFQGGKNQIFHISHRCCNDIYVEVDDVNNYLPFFPFTELCEKLERLKQFISKRSLLHSETTVRSSGAFDCTENPCILIDLLVAPIHVVLTCLELSIPTTPWYLQVGGVLVLGNSHSYTAMTDLDLKTLREGFPKYNSKKKNVTATVTSEK